MIFFIIIYHFETILKYNTVYGGVLEYYTKMVNNIQELYIRIYNQEKTDIKIFVLMNSVHTREIKSTRAHLLLSLFVNKR